MIRIERSLIRFIHLNFHRLLILQVSLTEYQSETVSINSENPKKVEKN
ncbi:hypothetical protein LEP1GSC047_2344 [Leptospira inadai serovar Lyme str. 10]|uniref:Uncharacterized protein n=1 Tax=Leptospira inadai serovar Lyme str. 10 TaxID=1049790 RepID=V6HDX6_9LEPT|nr:hypothetical protein LEP1GSC047_2344 [Leptospira inadai serovar Lyme str. 10]